MKKNTHIGLLVGVSVLLGPVLADKRPDTNLPSDSTYEIIDYPTCGPAAVVMILKMYGIPFDTGEVCDSTYIDDQRKSSVKSISDTFAKHRVYARGCNVSFEDLLQRTTPSILLSKNAKGTNHFLICVGNDGNELKLIDPLFVPFRKLSKDIFLLNKQKVAILTQLSPFKEYQHRINSLETFAMLSSILVFVSVVAVVCRRHVKSG